MDYGVDGRGSILGRGMTFLYSVQTGCRLHPASYPMGAGGSLSGGKAVGACSWSLTYNYAEVKSTWIYTSIRTYVFMA
jgi:hypothetical protein